MKKLLIILILVTISRLTTQAQDEYATFLDDTTEAQYVDRYNLLMWYVTEMDSLRDILKNELKLLETSYAPTGELSEQRDSLLWTFLGHSNLLTNRNLSSILISPEISYKLRNCDDCGIKQKEVEAHRQRISMNMDAIWGKAKKVAPEIAPFMIR